MKCISSSTEERIKEAAKKVFLEKGFEGATTRDIAQEAGLNSALMNYYFRSKEKLFSEVFEEMLQLFLRGTVEILNKSINLKDKIAELINHDFQMFSSNPSLAIFVLNELHRNSDLFAKVIPAIRNLHHAEFGRQLQESIERGEIRPIDPINLIPLIIGNIQSIFLCKPMTMQSYDMTEERFNEYAEQQKNLIVSMVTDYLFLKD